MNTVSPVKVFFALPFLAKIILLIFFIATFGIGWGLFWIYLLLIGMKDEDYRKLKIQSMSKDNQNNFLKKEALTHQEIYELAISRKEEDDFFMKKDEQFDLKDYITLIKYEKVNKTIAINQEELNKIFIIQKMDDCDLNKYDFSKLKKDIYSEEKITDIAISRKEMDDFFKSEEEKFTLQEYIIAIRNEPYNENITISKCFLDYIKLISQKTYNKTLEEK